MNKTIIWILFGLICLIPVMSIEECKGAMNTDEAPCLILLPSDSNCSTINVTIYNETTLLDNLTMDTYNIIYCNATFNYTSVGTYTFKYSTGDTGSIILSEGNIMIQLFWFGLILSMLLTILGLYLHNHPMIAISSFLNLILGLWIFIYGYSIYDNLVSKMIGTILIGVGGYFLILSTLALIDEGYDSDDYVD